jgi:hypothetical protein
VSLRSLPCLLAVAGLGRSLAAGVAGGRVAGTALDLGPRLPARPLAVMIPREGGTGRRGGTLLDRSRPLARFLPSGRQYLRTACIGMTLAAFGRLSKVLHLFPNDSRPPPIPTVIPRGFSRLLVRQPTNP